MADLLLERERLEQNIFWQRLIEEVEKRLQSAKNQCSWNVKAPLEDLRRLQGNVEAWQMFLALPDDIIKTYYENVDKTGESSI
jgi:hypothetical protein